MRWDIVIFHVVGTIVGLIIVFCVIRHRKQTSNVSLSFLGHLSLALVLEICTVIGPFSVIAGILALIMQHRLKPSMVELSKAIAEHDRTLMLINQEGVKPVTKGTQDKAVTEPAGRM